uniref:Cytochrome P450 n=2 Tax=Kalanchoe fedtschenkoi TaxID=63787 RepID=A0A7N1A8X9_KALFE
MDSTVTTATLTAALLSVLILTWAYQVINWLWLTPKRLERSLKRQGVKGTSYRILYGDMKENLKMMQEAKSKPIGLSESIVPRLLPYVDQCLKTYGNNSIMWLGPKPRILPMEPELIKDIFNKISDFRKQNGNPLTKLLATGVATYEDDKWVKHRKLINPAFHSEKIKIMVPAFYLSSAEMVEKWEKLVFEDESCELDVWPDLQNMTRDVISRTAFGSSYEEGKRIFELQRELTILVMQVALSVYIPGWRFVPTKTNRKMKALNRDIVASLRAIINKKEKGMKEGKTARYDLLGLLIESNWRETKGNNNDKTAGMTVTMILHEVLRLYPPVVFTARTVDKETKLGKLTLPAGVTLSVPILSIHHDRELWGEDAKEFNPARFAEGVLKATKGRVTFLPFGFGPRICIGQNFAMAEAKMALAMILRRFSFKLSPSYAHAPQTVLVVQPQHGARIILQKL